MLCCEISKGYLYYDEMHRRDEVIFTEELRGQVEALFKEMQAAFRRGTTPQIKPTKKCQSCSLKDLCLPKLCRNISVTDYYQQFLGDE